MLLGETRKKKAKRIKPRSHHFETLEPRQMLTADLLNCQLYQDTGAADNVTTNPMLTAVVGDLQPGEAKATVQFDHDGDGTPEAVLNDLIAGNTVLYEPRVADSAFPAEGPVTLLYRLLEMDGTQTPSKRTLPQFVFHPV